MKQKYFNYLLVFALLVTTSLFAGENNFKERVRREVKETFSVNPNALLEVNNSYGDLNITTWNNNTIDITVEIIVEGRSKSRIEDKLDDIEISFSASPQKVVANTDIEDSWGRGLFSFDNIHMEINYTIKMPVNGSVDLSNDYGAILLDQLNGKAVISCDYGKMILGELNGEDNELSFDYTNNSTIEYLRSGKINADYSGFEVGEAERISLNADYTNARFEAIGDLNFNMDYGKLNLGEVTAVKGSSDYTSILIDELIKNLKITSDYGSIRINDVSKDFETIDLNLEYISTQIGVNPNSSFNFELDLEYCSFSSQLPLNYQQKIQEMGEKYFSGSYNSKGQTSGTITIEAEYGSLKFK